MDSFTWAALATTAGATAATTLVVAILKEVFGLHGRSTQAAAFAVAEIITISAGLVTGAKFPIDALPLALNGMVVTAAAIGLRELKTEKGDRK